MALTRKPYAAFGTVIYKNTCPANDTYIFDTATADGACTTLVTAGVGLPVNNVTGQTIPLYQAGQFFRQYEYPAGAFTMNVQQDLEIFCYAPLANNDVIVAPFDAFTLLVGNQATLNVGTKMFLCRGTLDLDGVTLTGPMQISVKTGAKIAQANTDCYGFMYQ